MCMNIPYVSIMTAHINTNGKVYDGMLCKEIAQWINNVVLIEKTYINKVYNIFHELYDFVREYGEDVDETYCGRDAEGEKQYIVYNRETNWHARIRKELVVLGFYKELNSLQMVEV